MCLKFNSAHFKGHKQYFMDFENEPWYAVKVFSKSNKGKYLANYLHFCTNCCKGTCSM